MPKVRLIDGDRLAEIFEEAAERGAGVLATVYRDAAHFARTAPEIKPEVQRGRWISRKPDCRGYTEEFMCSECNAITYLHCCAKDCDYDFCPNCGAMMDGGADNG